MNLFSQFTNPTWNTELNMLTFSFEVAFEEVLKNPESYVDAVFSCLESELKGLVL